MNEYQFRHYSPAGDLLNVISDFHKMKYVRVENGIGVISLTLPRGDWRYEDFSKGQIIEVWRNTSGTYRLQNETAYFIQSWLFYKDEDGNALIDIAAPDANYLLSTRIVAYAAGSSEADKTDSADDMIKEIIDENLINPTDADRKITGITNAADLSASQSITKAFSWRNVLSVCQEIAEAATGLGTKTYFDLVRTDPATFQLRTYTGQRGTDHGRYSGDIRLVGDRYGNLKQPSFGNSCIDEKNYIYGGGQGEGVDREIVEVSDETAISTGYPYNRKEYFRDARNSETTAAVTAEANAALENNRSKQVLTGTLIDTPGMRFDVHYGFGDLISAEAFGFTVDCHVTTVICTVDSDKNETLEIRLRGEL